MELELELEVKQVPRLTRGKAFLLKIWIDRNSLVIAAGRRLVEVEHQQRPTQEHCSCTSRAAVNLHKGILRGETRETKMEREKELAGRIGEGGCGNGVVVESVGSSKCGVTVVARMNIEHLP